MTKPLESKTWPKTTINVKLPATDEPQVFNVSGYVHDSKVSRMIVHAQVMPAKEARFGYVALNGQYNVTLGRFGWMDGNLLIPFHPTGTSNELRESDQTAIKRAIIDALDEQLPHDCEFVGELFDVHFHNTLVRWRSRLEKYRRRYRKAIEKDRELSRKVGVDPVSTEKQDEIEVVRGRAELVTQTNSQLWKTNGRLAAEIANLKARIAEALRVVESVNRVLINQEGCAVIDNLVALLKSDEQRIVEVIHNNPTIPDLLNQVNQAERGTEQARSYADSLFSSMDEALRLIEEMRGKVDESFPGTPPAEIEWVKSYLWRIERALQGEYVLRVQSEPDTHE